LQQAEAHAAARVNVPVWEGRAQRDRPSAFHREIIMSVKANKRLEELLALRVEAAGAHCHKPTPTKPPGG